MRKVAAEDERVRPGPRRKAVKLSEKVMLCLTPSALLRVERAATVQGKSISEFCRDAATSRADKVLAGMTTKAGGND